MRIGTIVRPGLMQDLDGLRLEASQTQPMKTKSLATLGSKFMVPLGPTFTFIANVEINILIKGTAPSLLFDCLSPVEEVLAVTD